MDEKKFLENQPVAMDSQREITVGQLAEGVSRYIGKRCTPGMIDNYEKHGLLSHSSRTTGGVRLFTVDDIYTVICVKNLQSQGLSLTEIKDALAECPEEITRTELTDLLTEDRRTAILQACARIFPQKGYDATTMQDIAVEANIAPSMIYRYYKNKEDLFLSFAENTSFHSLLQKINVSLETAGEAKTFEDVHQTLLDVALNFTWDHSGKVELLRLLISTSRSFPEIGRHYHQQFIQPTEKLLEKYFDYLVKKGLFRQVDTALMSRVFFGAFADLALTRNYYLEYVTPRVISREEASEVIDLFLSGMFSGSHAK